MVTSHFGATVKQVFETSPDLAKLLFSEEGFCRVIQRDPDGLFVEVPCPDQLVGNVAAGHPSLCNFDRQPIPRTRRAGSLAIILVLESPHTDEFTWRQDCGAWVAIGPAAGPTGRNIRTHLSKILERFPTREYMIYLMNAIQHQCSLGQKLKCKQARCLRDKVFSTYWNPTGRNDFMERLSQHYHPGDILINACTGAKNMEDAANLKMMVEEAILCQVPSLSSKSIQWGNPREVTSDMGTHHPRSWFGNPTFDGSNDRRNKLVWFRDMTER
jgi:hypothetical protein